MTSLFRFLALVVALIGFLLLPSLATAQTPSACTALWGISNTGAPPLAYFNRTTNAFVNVAAPTNAVLTANGVTAISGNALAVFGGTGSLYFANANQRASIPGMIRAAFDNVAGTVTFANLGSISIPANITYTNTSNVISTAPTGAYIGATFDNSNNINRVMYVLASGTAAAANVPLAGTTTAGNIVAMVGLLDPEFPAAVSWKTIVSSTATGTVTYPIIGTSGDLYFDRTNQKIFYITNSATTRIMTLVPNRTGLTLNSVLIGSTATFSAAGVTNGNTFGIALDPASNGVYFTNNVSANFLVDSTTLNTSAVTSVAAGVAGAAYGDTGSCIDQPALPTIVKSFKPLASSSSVGTSTLTVTVINPNFVPIFTNAVLTDNLPANMVIANPLSASVECFSNGLAATRSSATTLTAVVGSTTFSVPSGAFIPGGNPGGGSCSFSVVVSATVAEIYPNVIPPGGLVTTAGNNTVAAQGTYTLRISDFQAGKSQRVGVSGTTTTSQITVPGGATMQYILTITNLGILTATTTFTDTIPALLTPSVAAVTAVPTGGGSCSTSTTVVLGQLQVTGVFSAAPPGAFCTVTVTQQGSNSLAISSSATNTITVSGSPTFDGGAGSDRNMVNNTATVVTSVGPSTNLQINKTNGVTALVSGATTTYTITIANLGPAAAPGAVFLDPAVAGLNCTTATFVSSPVGAITVSPLPLTLTAVQSTGVSFTAFPANSTATFTISCGVTATGQ